MFPPGSGATDPNAGGPAQGPGLGGGFPATPSDGMDPRAQRAFLAVATIVQSARQLALMFPIVANEARQVTDLMYQIQQKITSTNPSPGIPAPPA